MSADRDVPLSQKGPDGLSEPYLNKITKVQRDPRNKSLEKEEEFIPYPKQETNRMQINSLRSYGSINGLLTLIVES